MLQKEQINLHKGINLSFWANNPKKRQTNNLTTNPQNSKMIKLILILTRPPATEKDLDQIRKLSQQLKLKKQSYKIPKTTQVKIIRRQTSKEEMMAVKIDPMDKTVNKKQPSRNDRTRQSQQSAILFTFIKQEQVYCQNMTENDGTSTKLVINSRIIDQQLQLFENYKIIQSLPNVQESFLNYPDDIGQEGKLLPVNSPQNSLYKIKTINMAEFSQNSYVDDQGESRGFSMMTQYEQFHDQLLVRNKYCYRQLSSNIKTKGKNNQRKIQGMQKKKPKRIKIKLFKNNHYPRRQTTKATHTLQSQPPMHTFETQPPTRTLETQPPTKSINTCKKKGKFLGLSLSQSPLSSPCKKIKLYSCKKRGRNALQVLPSTFQFHQKGDSIMVRLRCFKKKNTGSPAKGIFLFSKEKDKQNKQVHKILAFPICSPIHLNSTNVSMRSPNSSKDKLPKIYSRNLKF